VQLSEGAQAVWDRLAPHLISKGCLSSWDLDLFIVYCDAAATYHDCRRAMGSDYTVKGSVKDTTVQSPLWRIMKDSADTMRSIGAKFGLIPSDRAGLDVAAVSDTSKPKTDPERTLSSPDKALVRSVLSRRPLPRRIAACRDPQRAGARELRAAPAGGRHSYPSAPKSSQHG